MISYNGRIMSMYRYPEEIMVYILKFKNQYHRPPSLEEVERAQWYPYYDDKPDRWIE